MEGEMNIGDFTSSEFKNKIKSLRSTYNQEIRKITKSEHSGMRTDEVMMHNPYLQAES
jgi:hypothetical protein